MSTEERNLPANKYWTNVDGERYLQVEEVDDECFRDADDENDAGEDNKEEEDEKKKESDQRASLI